MRTGPGAPLRLSRCRGARRFWSRSDGIIRPNGSADKRASESKPPADVTANAPLPEQLAAREVGTVAAVLCSPLASGMTGTTVYVDKGYHAMGMAVGEGL